MNRVIVARAAAVVLAAATGGCASEESSAPSTASVFDGTPALTAMRAVPQDGITLGRLDAPATMSMYTSLSDWNGDFIENVLPKLVQEFVAPGKLKIQLRTLTDGPRPGVSTRESEALAATAHAVGVQDRMWQFFATWSARFAGTARTHDVARAMDAVSGADVARAGADAGSRRVELAVERANTYARRGGYDTTPVFTLRQGNRDEQVIRAARPGGLLAALQNELE